MAAELKGSGLRGVLKDAKERCDGGIPALIEALPSDIREAHFSQPILHARWYPYEAFGALLDAHVHVVGRGNPQEISDLGGRMAARDFNTLLKIYSKLSSPQRLAGVPNRVWSQRFRDAGHATSEPGAKGERRFRFTIDGFPGIHPLHCHLLTGYGLAAGLRWAETFTNTHDRCVHRGDNECSFLSEW